MTLGTTLINHSCKPEQGLEELLNYPDPRAARKSYAITEAENFFFLPPIGEKTSYSGVFDAQVNPVVEICELPECNPPYHAEFTKDGAGLEKIRVDITDEHYIVNWHTNKTGAKVGSTYRITIKLNNTILGYADVIVVKNKGQAKKDGNNIVLVAGQTLPIKFRIEKKQEELDLDVMTNAADPLLITAKKNNKTIEVYGLRDELGIPTQLTDIIIKGQTTDKATHYKYNSQNQLSKIITLNKTQFLFEWISQTKAIVTVLANDGITQVNTEIDFSSSNATLTSSTQVNKQNFVLKRDKKPLKLQYSNKSSSKTASDNNSLNAFAAAESSVTINVTRCDTPADADVLLSARLVDGELVGTFPATRTSIGLYTASIPTDAALTVDVGDLCEKLEGVLGLACGFVGLPALCPALGIVLIVAKVPPTIIATIEAACAEAVFELEFYCATLGGDGTPGGGESIAAKICKDPGIDRTFTQDLVLTAYAIGLPNNIFGESQRVPGNGPFPNLSVDLGSTTKIESFQLIPSSPAEGQDYVASIDVFCVTQGSQATISIVGSDGYTDSISYSITSTQSQGNFSLTVPGAATGVQDVVTVEIQLADGTVLTRTASLVFN